MRPVGRGAWRAWGPAGRGAARPVAAGREPARDGGERTAPARVGAPIDTDSEARAMRSIFYIIGLIVVILVVINIIA